MIIEEYKGIPWRSGGDIDKWWGVGVALGGLGTSSRYLECFQRGAIRRSMARSKLDVNKQCV